MGQSELTAVNFNQAALCARNLYHLALFHLVLETDRQVSPIRYLCFIFHSVLFIHLQCIWLIIKICLFIYYFN